MGRQGRKSASLWDTLGGGGPNGGYRYKSSGGATYTVGKAQDRQARGGKYVSASRADGGKKTNVYDKHGNKVKSVQNNLW